MEYMNLFSVRSDVFMMWLRIGFTVEEVLDFDQIGCVVYYYLCLSRER